MEILKDKVIDDLIKSLETKLRKKTISSHNGNSLSAPRFVFVCGKEIIEGENTIRSHTINTLKKYKIDAQHDSVLCIISEKLYVQDISEDIFTFEIMLAEISDKIIIIAESPGTFCELGAFVMDEQCRAKTIVINEDKADYKNSFITKGPIKLLENQNGNNVILHHGLQRIKSNSEYSNKMKQVAEEKIKICINNNCKNVQLKGLIYELANIIELFQPLEYFEIETLYKKIKGFDSYKISNTAGHKIKSIKQVLALMEKMDVVRKEQGYYAINDKISCYNILFKLSRKEFDMIRITYLSRMEKCQPQRMEIV